MPHPPELHFLSLFVPDLDRAAEAYAAVFGLSPIPAEQVDLPQHPFSPKPPVVFSLGSVRLALWQIDGRVTHAGDVGIGVTGISDPTSMLAQVKQVGGQVLLPSAPAGDQHLSVFVLPDRHFFEILHD